MADKTKDATADKPAEAARQTQVEEAPNGWDVVGSDGRRILRGVSAAFAADEKGRIQAQTGEQLTVQPSQPPEGGGPIPIPEPVKPDADPVKTEP